MIWLVIASEYDEPARWVADRLPSAGIDPTVLVTDADFAGATWEHRLGADDVTSRLTLGDGRVIDSHEIRGTVNRLQQAPLMPLAPEDREYGFHESSALIVSWLASFPGPMLNPPDTRGLAGVWRSPAEWALLASEAGLPAAPVTIDSETEWPADGSGWRAWPPYAPIDEDIIVVGEAVFALEPLTESTMDACRRLACLAQTPILGLVFSCATCGGTPEVAAATPLPDLRAGGPELIEALVVALQGERFDR
jgi:hypothetical protein